MKIHSLKSKIVFLVLSCVLLLALCAALIEFYSLTRVLSENISEKMNLLCERKGLETDAMFVRIEDSVGMIEAFLQNQIESAEHLKNEKFRRKVLDAAESLFFAIANSTNGIVAHYVSLDPKLIDGIDGFLYKANSKGVLQKVALTDIRAYDENDAEHVGWFYIPVREKKSVWLEPYQNKNLDCYMISFVIPIFKNGTLLGIAGMDVDFKIMVNSVNTIVFNRSGSAYLKNAPGTLHYTANFINGLERRGDEIFEFTKNANLLEKRESGDQVVRYKFDKTDFVMAFVTLRNGMKLVLCDNYSEVFATRTNAAILVFAITTILGAIFVIIALHFAANITRPLQKLAKAVTMLSENDLDFVLPQESNDELGILVSGVKKLCARLQKYSSSIEPFIYRDELTKVKNGAAYRLAVTELEQKINSGMANFALVVCGLKLIGKTEIHDKFSESASDEVIKNVCALICKSFPHSAVFRIEKSEFVVFLKNTEYSNRAQILQKFDEASQSVMWNAKDAFSQISLVYGTSIYLPEQDKDYQQVFERARAEMYSKKF